MCVGDQALARGVSLQAKIRRISPQLVLIIEPDYGLLDELLSLDILDDIQVDHVQGGVNVHERINRLLEYFKNESDDVCEQFLTSLKNTKQHHVVSFIEHDGGYQKIVLSNGLRSRCTDGRLTTAVPRPTHCGTKAADLLDYYLR